MISYTIVVVPYYKYSAIYSESCIQIIKAPTLALCSYFRVSPDRSFGLEVGV